MTRPEVEDLARAALVGGAAAEDLAALEPGDEDQFVRLRNAERFAVHLLLREFDVLADAFDDRVPLGDDPEPLLLVGLAPLQIAGGAHQPLEDLREVTGVQDDQAGAVEHPLVDRG